MSCAIVFPSAPATMRGAHAPIPINPALSDFMDLHTGIPHPNIAPYRPDRKSHARKRPEGHVPRPKNAWIWFRSDFVYLQSKLGTSERSQTALTKLASDKWARLTPEQKSPWEKLAQQDKAAHAAANPNYHFRPQNKESPSVSAASGRGHRIRASNDDDGDGDYTEGRRRSTRSRRGAPLLKRSDSVSTIEASPVPTSDWSLTSSASLSSNSSSWSDSPVADSMPTWLAQQSFNWEDVAADFHPVPEPTMSAPTSTFTDATADVAMDEGGGLTGWSGPSAHPQVPPSRSASRVPHRRTSSCPPPINLTFNRPAPVMSSMADADLGARMDSIAGGHLNGSTPSAPVLHAPMPRVAARDDERFERRPSLAHVVLNEQWGAQSSFAYGANGVEALGAGAYDQRAGEMRLEGYENMLGEEKPVFTYEISPTYGKEWLVPDYVTAEAARSSQFESGPASAAYSYGFNAPAAVTSPTYSSLANAFAPSTHDLGLRLDTGFAMRPQSMLSSASPSSAMTALTPTDSVDWTEWLHSDNAQLSPIGGSAPSLSPLAISSSLYGALGPSS